MAKRQLRMNNRDNARRSLARLIREFDADPDADVQRFRALVSAFSALLAYDRLAEGTGCRRAPADPRADTRAATMSAGLSRRLKRLEEKLHVHDDGECHCDTEVVLFRNSPPQDDDPPFPGEAWCLRCRRPYTPFTVIFVSPPHP